MFRLVRPRQRRRRRVNALVQPPLGALLDSAPAESSCATITSENLLWLPERSGSAGRAAGFPDALQGHPAYDLVSILHRRGRDVAPAPSRPKMIAQLTSIKAAGKDGKTAFRSTYAPLGLNNEPADFGIFARLCCERCKAHYMFRFQSPRVWEKWVQAATL